MLKNLYKLPKALIAFLVIGAGIAFIIFSDPPNTFCDAQIEHFKKIQTGFLYKNPKDFRQEKSAFKRKKDLCEKESAPGICYEYFAYIQRLLKDFHVLSHECAPLIYSTAEVKKALAEAITLMTALAWREEVLTGRVSKYNWLSKADLFLFCDIQRKYILFYGDKNYNLLEDKILALLPVEANISPQLMRRRTILSEPCSVYR